MNETGNILGVIMIVGLLFSMIFYVLFGQLTVRKLRKNQETKDNLGIELASGLDVLNVAGALTRPKWLDKRIKASPTSSFATDSKMLYQHTTIFDRILARLFCIIFYSTGTFTIFFIFADLFGAFD